MPEDKNIEPKAFEQDFDGGKSIDLDRVMDGGGTVEEALSREMSTILEKGLSNQQGLIDKISKWQRQYIGDKDEKTHPYSGCSNIAIPLTRWLIDTVLVRVIDVIFGQKKVWILRATKPEFKKLISKFEDGLDWWQKYILKFREKIFSPLMQGVKMGTGIIFFKYVKQQRFSYRYATDTEKTDRNVKKYKTAEGESLVKKPITTFEGPNIFPVSREDFVIDSEAATIDDARLVGFRTYVWKSEIESKVRQGIYREGIIEHLRGDSIDDTKKTRAEVQEKVVEEFDKDRPQIWELWTRFDVDDDGEEDDIVITFHKETGTILRAIYNPLFIGFRPLVKLVGLPVEYSFDGDGLCGILEQVQEGVDTTHNQRIDRMNQINAPQYIIREGSGIEGQTTFPGKKWIVDNVETAIKMLAFPDVYPSNFTEEAVLNEIAQKSVGVTPGVMGMPTSERPVARETMQLIQEANKKFKFIIDNLREAFKQIGMMGLEYFAQYQPKWTYHKDGEQGMSVDVVEFPKEFLRDGIVIDLYASSELLNQEVRRQINMVVYQLMRDYFNQMGQLLQTMASGMLPPATFPYFMQVIMLGGKMMREILKDFDIVDADEMFEKLEQAINPEQLMKQAQMIQQQMQQRMQQEQAMQMQQKQRPQGAKQ